MTLPALRSVGLSTGEATYLCDGNERHPVVALLHGGGLDCATLSWRCLLPVLAREYLVVAPNWPGYAGSAPFGRPHGIADLGTWLMEFLDALQIERAVLVGVSMGGGAALWSAIHYPDRVTALVPVGTYGVAPRAPYHLMSYILTKLPMNAVSYAVMRRNAWSVRKLLESIFADPQKVSDEIVMEVRNVLASAGSGQAFTHFQRSEISPVRLNTVLTPQLPSIPHPTLFIHGSADTLIPAQAVVDVANAMQDANVEIMDAGHWPMRENPTLFNSRVTSFLRECNSRQAI